MGITGCTNLINWGIAFPQIQEITQIKNETNLTQSVIIQGKIEKSIPLLNSYAYKIKDETGSIWVVTPSQKFEQGEDVTIQGQLKYRDITIEDKDWGEFYVVADN